MNIDTSYSVRTQQSQQTQQFQKSTQTASTSAVSTTATVQKDGTKVEYAAAVTSIESGDRVEISAEGQKALAQMQTAQSDTQSEVKESVRAQPAVPSGAKPTGSPLATAASTSTEDSSGDEEVSSSELHTLSETKLQSLLSAGSITQSEYTSELARRGLDSAS